MTYSPSESTRHFHKSVSCSQSLPLRWWIQPRIVRLCKYARHVPELCPQIPRPVPLLKCQYHHCRSRRLPSQRACWKSVYDFVMECRYPLIVYFVRRSLRQVQDAKVSCAPSFPMMTLISLSRVGAVKSRLSASCTTLQGTIIIPLCRRWKTW